MTKAKKTAIYRDKYFTTIEYEYRNHYYEVTYPNGHSICCTPAHIQHRDAQDKIDNLINNLKPEKEQQPFQEQLDEIWSMMGW